ncbi:SYJ2B-like protein [Mya arenaria]|uniref:SYJ2B-like protein n=1 Tax=Mya arenaria TaxID=6604 RepID=A0ABY7FFJ7_MYAAR|nr:synaptojanin-2-binding protein-like [Mya arenaria]WAR20159.1 SYJ2B-like protein [Mya arenaria]
MSDALPLKKSTITLSRGDTGLGFNIRGGIDNPHIPGDSGIFVTKVRENGAAFRDGRLKEGDKILQINGTSLVDVSHSQAVQCFTSAKDSVTLEVLHGAQDYIMKQRGEQTEKPDDNTSSYEKYVIGACVLGAAIVLGVVAYRRFSPQRFTSYR